MPRTALSFYANLNESVNWAYRSSSRWNNRRKARHHARLSEKSYLIHSISNT